MFHVWKRKKKNIKITRDGREPGLLRGVCFFVYDMVQRTSAGCPVQPERGVTSVLAQSHVLNTHQALWTEEWNATFWPSGLDWEEESCLNQVKKGDNGNQTWLKNAILDSSSPVSQRNKQWSPLKRKGKKTSGREGKISLKTQRGHGSENSFLQNYIRISVSVSSQRSQRLYKTRAGISTNKNADIKADLQRMLAEIRRECNSKSENWLWAQ